VANAPYSEQTELQRRKVEMLRTRLLDLGSGPINLFH